MEIALGAKAKVPVRLIIESLPDEAVAQRKRRQRQRAKKRGRTPSAQQLALLGYNCYVTHVDASVFPAHVIQAVYSLRWQIELVFKAIFIHLGFELIAGKREDRIKCQLYGRLIVLVISLFLTGQFRQQLWSNHSRQLSLLKSFAPKPLVAPQILAQLRHQSGLLRTLWQGADEMMTLCRMDQRAPRLSTAEILRGLAI